MIITVTLNPAVDKTAETGALCPGGLNRLKNIISDAGGKGINVSKTIAALGGESVASGFIGGSAGEVIEDALNELKIKTDFVKIQALTRTNLKVFSPDIGITEFNEPGAAVTDAELKGLEEKLLKYSRQGVIFVFSGSLPEGAPPDTYKRLIETVHKNGATAFLDADGEPFRLALMAKPDFIKQNKYELLKYFGADGELSARELIGLCKRLVDGGVGTVALSMGAEGAIFVTSEMVLNAPGIDVKALSTVGAGDAMVGAFVYSIDNGFNFKSAAALAMAASAGAVMTEGTKPPGRETADELLKKVRLYYYAV